jgi:hypothetical protein
VNFAASVIERKMLPLKFACEPILDLQICIGHSELKIKKAKKISGKTFES